MGDSFRYHLHTQIPYIHFGSIDSYRLSMVFMQYLMAFLVQMESIL